MEEKESKVMLRKNGMYNPSKLREFAFLDTPEVYLKKLEYLEKMAESEIWTIKQGKNLDVLKFYIDNVFERAEKTNKIKYSKDKAYCCFNTGLLTNKFDSIIALFSKNNKPNAQEWFFMSFFVESDRFIIEKFDKIPEIVYFYNNTHELFFNSEHAIITSNEHIIDDNFERFPKEIQALGAATAFQLLKGALDDTKKQIERNHRMVVPQFYKDKIMFLVPITMLVGTESFTMALAVEQINTKYRANTIFSLEMAYSLARLVSKPETNWLLKKEKEPI